jgi:hypothetical protein
MDNKTIKKRCNKFCWNSGIVYLRVFLLVESSECVFPLSTILLFTDVLPDNDVRMRISDDEYCIIDRYGAA